MMLDYFSLIQKHLGTDSEVYRFYVPHVVQVTAKALAVARHLQLSEDQLRFIEEAAMLHDIGVVKVRAEDIGCHGELPYISHGVEGSKILEAEGCPEHARVCERHTGVGIRAVDIKEQGLPLPERDMLPETLEEQVICYADKWYSKDPKKLWKPYKFEEITAHFQKFSRADEMIETFTKWRELSEG